MALWAQAGRHFGLRTRLRVSGRLARRLLSDGQAYRGGNGFTLQIDRDDPFQAAMLLGLYDPVVADLTRRHVSPGSITVDAGAHLGYFSLRMAFLTGPTGAVHSFECDPRLLRRLERHVALNGFSWVNVNDCGLLDRDVEQLELYLPGQLGWSSTVAGAWGATESATVRMVTLDRYVADHAVDPLQISFIKLDVEGSELQALQGAADVLANTEAAVLVEYIPERMRAMGQNPEDLLSLMDQAGYEPWSPMALRRNRVVLAPGSTPATGEDVLFLKPGRGRQGAV